MKVAVIGMGAMGQKHYTALCSMEDIEIVGLVDPAIDPALPSHPVFSTVKDLLASQVVDCAIIATPTSTHCDVALELIKSGIHVLIEKPVAKNVSQAHMIRDLAFDNGCKVAVGYIERFNPAVQTLKKSLEGEKILSCHFTRFSPPPQRITDVGVSLDLSVHDIDLAAFLIGSPVKDYSRVFTYPGPKAKENNATFFLHFDSSIAIIESSWSHFSGERELKVRTDKSYYEVGLFNGSVSKWTPLPDGSFLHNDMYLSSPNKKDALTEQLKSFFEYVKLGVANDIATLYDGTSSLKIALGK